MVEEQKWVNCRRVERVDGLRKGTSVVMTGRGDGVWRVGCNWNEGRRTLERMVEGKRVVNRRAGGSGYV